MMSSPSPILDVQRVFTERLLLAHVIGEGDVLKGAHLLDLLANVQQRITAGNAGWNLDSIVNELAGSISRSSGSNVEDERVRIRNVLNRIGFVAFIGADVDVLPDISRTQQREAMRR